MGSGYYMCPTGPLFSWRLFTSATGERLGREPGC
jgi:hypothetical protein